MKIAVGEAPNSNNDDQQNNVPTPWDSLALNPDGTRNQEYLNSEKGQEELAIEETFDKWSGELDDMVKEGNMSAEEAKAQKEMMLDSAIEGIDQVRKEAHEESLSDPIHSDTFQLPYTETPALPHTEVPQLPYTEEPTLPHAEVPELPSTETPEDTPLLPHDEVPQLPYTEVPQLPYTEQPEEMSKTKAEEIAKLKAEALAKVKAEELAKRKTEAVAEQSPIEELEQKEAFQKQVEEEILRRKEAEQRKAELEVLKRKEAIQKKIEEELARRKGEGQDEPDNPDEPDYDKPLVAINADFTVDKEELAHDFAEQQLNADVAKAGIIGRIWKGNLFKKYYQKKYEREIMSGDRTVGVGEDGEEMTVDDVIKHRSDSAIARFVMGATDEYGEAYIHTKAGEELTDADAKTTESVKNAIEWYANADIPEGGSLEDLREEFGNRIKLMQAEARDEGEEVDAKLINNYFEVAVQARERVEHGIAIEKVMEGFKVYNAEVRNNVRSDAHRDNLDKIIDKLESSKIGSVVPPELIAAAVGSAFGLTQRGARAIAGPALGLGVSGVFAGLKERNRVTEDRTRMIRDIAAGYEYGDTPEDEDTEEKKLSKYETRLGGTLYEMRSAADLTSQLEQATESEDGSSESLLQAIAEARVRIDMSDSENKDLISYSSADNLGDERLKLDIALIRAEKSLSEEDQAKLAAMKESIQNSINEDIDEKDQDFRKLRTAQALKQAGKTVAIGAVAFFGSQEIIAAVDPGKIGLLEKTGILHVENKDDASETILAGLAGPRIRVDTIDNISGDDLDAMKRYEDAGYSPIETKPGWTETKKDLVDIKPSESVHRIKATYDGWANNGTPRVYDGNELGIDLNEHGFVSTMSGNSTMNGQSFNYGSLASRGDVKGFITIGNAKFEVASTIDSSGRLTWPIDSKGSILTTTGESIPAIGRNGEKLYKYFEVALDNGSDSNGFTHIMPFATDVGRDSFNGTIKEIRETIIEHPPTYSFTKEVPRDVFYGGIIVPGPTTRAGLGGPNTTPQPEEPESPEPEPTSEPQPEEPESPEPEPTPEPAPQPAEAPDNPTPVAEAPEQPSQPGEPTPEPTPEPQPEEPESPEPEPTPEEDSEETPEDRAYASSIQERFGSIVGEEGVRFMSSKRGLGKGDYQALADWWISLNDDGRNFVLDFERNPDNTEYGNMLRLWLQMQNLL